MSGFLAPKCKESEDICMNMPGEDSKVFELFTHWLYQGSVPYPTSVKGINHLVDFYIFTQKGCINEVADRTMEAIISGYYYKRPEMTPERVEKI